MLTLHWVSSPYSKLPRGGQGATTEPSPRLNYSTEHLLLCKECCRNTIVARLTATPPRHSTSQSLAMREFSLISSGTSLEREKPHRRRWFVKNPAGLRLNYTLRGV